MAGGLICTRPLTAGAALLIFYLYPRRNTKAASRFLGKILNNVKRWQIPHIINTDKAPTYARALALLKRQGKCPPEVEHRQIKYRNNVIECDHGNRAA
jgi:IS6 family transposase